MSVQILIFCFVFAYGIVIGSFLNVCIYRLPKHESLVTVGSHCMKCNAKIKWYDLIPVFSFLFLRGRCRKCGYKISWQYPIAEMLNGMVYIFLFWYNGINIWSGIYCLLFSALLTLSVIDYRTKEIPFGINVCIFVLGIAIICVDYTHFMDYIIGFFAASVILFICLLVTRGKGIGGGDIKLMAAAGLCVGWQNILLALVLGCLIGSIVEITKMVITKKKGAFAFGPYLSMGIMLSLLIGNMFWDWYLSLMI